MHHLYFPACPVEGPYEPPVPFCHMGTRGAIPNKCGSCSLSFEGGCLRCLDKLHRYMHLDFGPCGIQGPTDPVVYEDAFVRAKVEVPRKCTSCSFLFHGSSYGFTCRKDADKWGGCHRGLDWGAWRPDRVYLQLPHPKVSSKALINHAYDHELMPFITEHRRLNPGLSMAEARADFAQLRGLIEEMAETSVE